MTIPARYYLGLDLGPPGEPTGLAVLERPALEKIEGDPEYHLRHLQRFPPGTSFTAIFDGVAECTANKAVDKPTTIVDQTAVGSQLIKKLRRTGGCGTIHTVTLSASGSVQKAEDGSEQVPKKELVTALQLVLQTRRLKVPPSLPDAELLLHELAGFRMRTVSLGDAPLAWREGRQDDLVLAVALTVWWAERFPPRSHPPFAISGGGGFLERVPEGVFLT